MLSRVFKWVHEDHGRTGSLGWLAVSHVCRYWRQCALNDRHLWATFNWKVFSRSLLNVFLERCGASVPLTIIIDISHSDNILWNPAKSACLNLLASSLHRIQTLSYSKKKLVTRKDLAALTAFSLTKPAPLLRVLRLHGAIEGARLVGESCHLEHFLAKLAPNIQDVELGQFPPTCFPWASPPAHIRTLHLSADSKANIASPLTFISVLDGLCAMSSLEALTLSGIVTNLSGGDISDQAVIDLPHLQTLRLDGPGEQHVLLWSLLKMRSSCSVRLKVTGLKDSKRLRVAWSQRWARSDPSASWEMVLDESGASGLSFSASPYYDGDNPLERGSTRLCPRIDISLTWNTSHTHAVALALLPPFQRRPCYGSSETGDVSENINFGDIHCSRVVPRLLGTSGTRDEWRRQSSGTGTPTADARAQGVRI